MTYPTQGQPAGDMPPGYPPQGQPAHGYPQGHGAPQAQAAPPQVPGGPPPGYGPPGYPQPQAPAQPGQQGYGPGGPQQGYPPQGAPGYDGAPAQVAPPTQAPPQGQQAPPAQQAPGMPGFAPPAPTGPTVVQTDKEAADGLKKCARCGATQISLNIETGNLRCEFCRYEAPSPNALATYGLDGPPRELVGTVVGSGSQDIIPSTSEVLTFKCSGCGAEVVIDTNSSTQARCHWCRNMLSMNQQIPNGAVPDMILPFRVPKEAAVDNIDKFVGKRMFFAHPKFKAEFEADNVMGVYLPYMVVDVNAKIHMSGQGEHQTRTYTETTGSGDNKTTTRYYDADVYNVTRNFDLYIDDLTVESSTERLDQNVSRNTNNIINTIMPFDVENSVVYDSNYLSGFSSERRDTNLEDLTPIVQVQSQDVARYHANDTIQFYDRGVRWDDEQIHVEGQRWVSAYLPVWLYSYHEHKSSGKEFTHYVAVNGRTGETMGSVPINQMKLIAVSAAIQIFCIILMIILLAVL